MWGLITWYTYWKFMLTIGIEHESLALNLKNMPLYEIYLAQFNSFFDMTYESVTKISVTIGPYLCWTQCMILTWSFGIY